MAAFQTIQHRADLCVVGGGLAGICAALAAARHGLTVVLMHERPMLGGNASSEIRMWVSGAVGKNNRETGILEEFEMENQYRNHGKNYSIWDSILFGAAITEKRLTLLLNCTCNQCVMDAAAGEGGTIQSVTGWQMTTQTFHQVEAVFFADCSGDSVLAPLTGARYLVGRENRREHGEALAQPAADMHTMGMSCLLQAREEAVPSSFIPPSWAAPMNTKAMKYRRPDLNHVTENFWYLELGGNRDSIHDTEEVRNDLVKLAYGMWDYVKNDPENREKNKNWRLDWVGMLPGKRESRRYAGDYILSQNDIDSGNHFPDIAAYGGWPMDNHHPGGFNAWNDPPTVMNTVPKPYGIPYRCLYSVNINNLFFAGRNISATHIAMSSTRVMGTCALLGQAAGTAAYIASKYSLSPCGVYQQKITELQDILLEDDCWLLYQKRKVPQLSRKARLACGTLDAEPLRDGHDRPEGKEDHGVLIPLGRTVEYRFDTAVHIKKIRIVFDSDLNRETLTPNEVKLKRNMWHNRSLSLEDSHVPKTMIRAFKINVVFEDGSEACLVHETCNFKRLFMYEGGMSETASNGLSRAVSAIRLTPLETWGNPEAHIFSFEVYD
jgi:hypothetical protein